MSTIFIRCYAELNDLLPQDRRYVTFPLSLPPHSVLLDVLNNIGIPSELIDVALVNTIPVGLATPINENDRIAFYPVFEKFDISSVTQVRDHPLRQPKFILDVHLGKLSHHLRMFGFDALYRNNWTKESIISISRDEHRTFLTRSTQDWIRQSLSHFYIIQQTDPRLQIFEVLNSFDLFSLIAPFTRCIACNTHLCHAEREVVIDRIPEKVKSWCQEYQSCPVCGRIYWKGSHYEHMEAFVQDVLRMQTAHRADQ